jgi:copper homeostasis protein (lipoprotein)
MKKKLIFAVLLVGIIACKENSENQVSEKPDMHTSRLALDWNGIYTGKLPCADCEGILMEIRLYDDLTYLYHSVYEGKSKEILSSTGTFKWNEDGNTISLYDTENKHQHSFHVGENKLFLLDQEGNRIEGALAERYTLNKVQNDKLSNIYFKADRFNGKAVTFFDRQNDMIHIRMDTVDMKIFGHAGCNTFRGGFSLDHNDKILFNPLATTLMACEEEVMLQEQHFLSVFERTKGYSYKGDSLFYYDDKGNELALFIGLRMFNQ